MNNHIHHPIQIKLLHQQTPNNNPSILISQSSKRQRRMERSMGITVATTRPNTKDTTPWEGDVNFASEEVADAETKAFVEEMNEI